MEGGAGKGGGRGVGAPGGERRGAAEARRGMKGQGYEVGVPGGWRLGLGRGHGDWEGTEGG